MYHYQALLHLAFSINTQSEPIKGAGNFPGNFNPSLRVNPLAWLGDGVAIYADKDPFWDEPVRSIDRVVAFAATRCESASGFAEKLTLMKMGDCGDDTADCLRHLTATKARTVIARKPRGL